MFFFDIAIYRYIAFRYIICTYYILYHLWIYMYTHNYNCALYLKKAPNQYLDNWVINSIIYYN